MVNVKRWPWNLIHDVFGRNRYVWKVIDSDNTVYDVYGVCNEVSKELDRFSEERSRIITEHYHMGRTYVSIAEEMGKTSRHICNVAAVLRNNMSRGEFFFRIMQHVKESVPGCMDYPLAALLTNYPFLAKTLYQNEFYTMDDIRAESSWFMKMIRENPKLNWEILMDILTENGYYIQDVFPIEILVQWLTKKANITISQDKGALHFPTQPDGSVPDRERGKRPDNPYRCIIQIDLDFDTIDKRDDIHDLFEYNSGDKAALLHALADAIAEHEYQARIAEK
ncbi:MAG: hypothetical protein K2F99_09525 [Muribaculaceae bacterium]|nr:hypothetical protein [Muribaculaceae bacterium]